MGLNKPNNTTGVSNHNDLDGRLDADGHPIEAISGLVGELNTIGLAVTGAVNDASAALSAAGNAATNASEAETKADDALSKVGTLTSLQTSEKSNLVAAINENFTNANNGKVVIASAVNGKGGTANSGMTFPQLADAVTAIPNLTEATGDAVAADTRAGKTFSTSIGNGIVGTMPERQGDTAAGTSAVVGTTLKLRPLAGIYDGVDDYVTITDADFIAANVRGNIFGLAGSIVDRAGDNVAAASSISGKTLKLRPPTGYYDGVDDMVTITDADFIAANLMGNVFGLAGSIVNRAGDNVALADTRVSTTLKLRPPAGYYDGVDDTVTITDADYIAANVREGVTLPGGLVGTMIDGAGLKKTATGTWSVSGGGQFTVTGLTFTPSRVVWTTLTNAAMNGYLFGMLQNTAAIGSFDGTTRIANAYGLTTYTQSGVVGSNAITSLGASNNLVSGGFNVQLNHFGGGTATVRWTAYE